MSLGGMSWGAGAAGPPPPRGGAGAPPPDWVAGRPTKK